ncbi:hypothetical protein HPG69_002748 [Diceros bicornis minor]|uniref:Uncharacterized protein n=1 Tax=Diceros bicornis minor TaxID=77932 RepID=A0A7J7FMW1_DICBM|nr:hypothetical protein HPG69_002748 [Diceros bicornis minor]
MALAKYMEEEKAEKIPSKNPTENVFCNFSPILNLTYMDTGTIVLTKVVDSDHAVEIITETMFMVLAYLCVPPLLCRLTPKGLSTCVSQLAIFLIFFGSVALMYLLCQVLLFLGHSHSLMFAVVSSFFNLVIYSLRNKEIKEAIKMLMCQSVIFRHHIK